jgi:hypothetical protein
VNREGAERRSVRPIIFGGLVVSLIAVWVIWWQWDAITGGSGKTTIPETEVAAVKADSGLEDAGSVAERDSGRSEQTLAEDRWKVVTGQAPVWPEDLTNPQSCEEVEADLARICAVLDQRDYVREAAPAGGSCGLIRVVVEELAANPPNIASELESYETILANVFYMFRSVGRERVDLLRRIQWEEHELAEPASMALYRWAVSRERCARSGSTTLKAEPLYNYAGFFFTTMGGQAYLRRRAPRVEALASLYGLLIVDRAQQSGLNPAGIDPRPEIERTRAMIEVEPLVFREHYLLILDQMAERWKERS